MKFFTITEHAHQYIGARNKKQRKNCITNWIIWIFLANRRICRLYCISCWREIQLWHQTCRHIPVHRYERARARRREVARLITTTHRMIRLIRCTYRYHRIRSTMRTPKTAAKTGTYTRKLIRVHRTRTNITICLKIFQGGGYKNNAVKISLQRYTMRKKTLLNNIKMLFHFCK